MAHEIGKLTRLELGYAGETGGRVIEIDMSEWLNRWPDAMFAITVVRHDEEVYPAVTEEEGSILKWTLDEYDTEIAGKGFAQFRAMDRESGTCYKSRIVETRVKESIDGFDEPDPPDPMQGWLAQLLGIKQDTISAKDDALQAVEDGAEYIDGKKNEVLEAANGALAEIDDGVEAIQKAEEAGVANVTGAATEAVQRVDEAADDAYAMITGVTGDLTPPILVDKEIYNGGSTLAPNVTGAAVGRALQGLHIYGKAAQSATPSPSAPADLDVIAQNGSITTTIKEVYISGVDDGIPSPQGMTVAVGDPLCGVPAMLGGQHIDADNMGWIADEVDYAAGKIIRRTHRVRLTSTSHAWATTSISTRFAINNPRPTMISGIAPVCSHFRGIAKITTGTGWVANNGGTQLVFSTDFATVDEWKAWLDANEVWLVYALAEETEQDMAEDEVAAYNAIRMHALSAVSNDAGADMLMTVMADTKTYVDRHTGSGGDVVDAPVKSVNGKTGDVVLTAEDVGAERKAGTYVLLETITVTDADAGTLSFVRNNYGNLSAVMINCFAPKQTANGNIFATFYVDEYKALTCGGAVYRTAGDSRARYKMRPMSGIWDAECEYGSASASGTKYGQTKLQEVLPVAGNENVIKIDIYTFAPGFAIGTVFDIWGVRANA